MHSRALDLSPIIRLPLPYPRMMSTYPSRLCPYGVALGAPLETDDERLTKRKPAKRLKLAVQSVGSDSNEEIEYLGTRPRSVQILDEDDDDDEVVFLGSRTRIRRNHQVEGASVPRRATSTPIKGSSFGSHVPRKVISGDCPICYEDFEPNTEEIVWCKAGCGNNVHRTCFDNWRPRSLMPELCCVFWSVPRPLIRVEECGADDGLDTLAKRHGEATRIQQPRLQ